MTLKVDSARLLRERRKRAWTQQHLADVSGLGIRTIQRIEKGETASPESIQAIAACLELGASDLIVLPPETVRSTNARWVGRLALLFVVLIAGSAATFLSTREATARDVTLDFTTIAITAEGDEYEHTGQMVVADGEASAFEMNRVFRIEVTPSILEDARVSIAMKVFADVDGDYVLVAEPSLVTLDEREAVFDLGLTTGPASRIRVAMVPSIQTP